MSAQDDPATSFRALRDVLRGTPSAETFLAHLDAASASLGVDPPRLPTPALLSAIDRHLPAVQQALMLTAVPTFLPVLDPSQRRQLVALFAPPRHAGPALSAARAVARTTFLTLASLLPTSPVPSRAFLLDMIAAVQAYSIDDLYYATYALARADAAWPDVVRASAALPARLANACGAWAAECPVSARAYFATYAARLAGLLADVHADADAPALVRVVLERLHALGLFVARADDERAPAFFRAFLPALLRRLRGPASIPAGYLPSLVLPLPTAALASFAAGLVSHLCYHLRPTDRADAQVRRAAAVLGKVVGPAEPNGEAWSAVLPVLVHRRTGQTSAEETKTRVIVAWAATGGEPAAKALLDAIMDGWTDVKYIRYTVFTQQYLLTHALVFALSLLRPFHPQLIQLARRPRFLHAIQAYLSHPDPRVRRLGMLVAELLSELTIADSANGDVDDEREEMEALKAGLEVDEDGEARPQPKPKKAARMKRLKFGSGIWEGQGDGKEECRSLRALLGSKDGDARLDNADEVAWLLGWDKQQSSPSPSSPSPAAAPPRPSSSTGPRASGKSKPKPKPKQPKIVMLDAEQFADPLEGYASPPGSPRSEPDEAFLDEVHADPSLALDAAQRAKIRRPVYVAEVVALLGKSDKADEIEVGLRWGEELVRAKRAYGTEVGENALAIARYAVGLHDQFHLDDFEERRQGLVTALVACSPRNVAPFLAEQYFGSQYSLHQRSVMLTALAMGARELAGLPGAPIRARAIDFPSKTLPPILHARYTSALEDVASSVRGSILSSSARKGQETVPELQRQRRLRIGSRRAVSEVAAPGDGPTPSGHALPPPVVPYAEVAAEYFVLPLINRFWQHLQEASTRLDAGGGAGPGTYRGAGTAVVLSALAVETLLMTLAVLVHAARHAAVFGAVLAPEALELAVTVGARHPVAFAPAIGSGDDRAHKNDHELEPAQAQAPEAQVVGAALDLALVVLDAAAELDAGRALAIDRPELVLAAGEWAQRVLEAEQHGARAAGERTEGRVRANAAGVVVKVAEIGERWRVPHM
ncbi:telomere binding protein [Cryptotrichosporon argae]